jgi:hypothetical protein
VIDFKSPSFVKLSAADNSVGEQAVGELLVDGEAIFQTMSGSRDMVIFTNKRIIAVNAQGMTGKKKDYTSLPYSKIQAFSFETAGTFDRDCEMDLWFSGLGVVRFEFTSKFDIHSFSRAIAAYVL